AGRYAYTAPMLSLFSPGTSLAYSDYQGLVGFDLSAHDRLSVLAFGAYDDLTQQASGGAVATLFNASFHRIDVRRDHRVSESTWMREALTFGADRLEADDRVYRNREIRARVELTHHADAITVRAGADGSLDAFERHQPGGSAPPPFPSGGPSLK